MNVEIGAEAALFPEKEYRSGIFVAVCSTIHYLTGLSNTWRFFVYRSILEPVEALDEVQALLVVGLGGPAGVLQALPHRIAGAAPCNRQNSSLPSPIVI